MFKPQLCPNEKVDLKSIKFPMLASFKLDGIRAIFKDGELYSRSLKILPNVNLHKRFESLKTYSKNHNVILDGELYCTSVPFNDLSGIIRSDNQELPYDLEFWCFDYLDDATLPFEERYNKYYRSVNLNKIDYFHPVVQKEVDTPELVEKSFEFALENGFEGLILRNPSSLYKFGRVTARSGDAYKVKPFETFDTKIVGVIQSTEVNEDVEKKTNELGRSVTSKKKGERHLIEKASAFLVKYNGLDLKVTLAMTDEEKEEVWKNKENYIGRIIEYKGMLVGSKDLPRHPVFCRFRDDK